LCFSTRNVEASHKMWRELENFGTSFQFIPCINLLTFHKNKIHARVVLEMAVFPALSSVILTLLIGKLHSFHRWSWFLRWCSKFPLILIVMVKLNQMRMTSLTQLQILYYEKWDFCGNEVALCLKYFLPRQFETFRLLGMVVKFYSLPF
jgi:hypothetical protein